MLFRNCSLVEKVPPHCSIYRENQVKAFYSQFKYEARVSGRLSKNKSIKRTIEAAYDKIAKANTKENRILSMLPLNSHIVITSNVTYPAL